MQLGLQGKQRVSSSQPKYGDNIFQKPVGSLKKWRVRRFIKKAPQELFEILPLINFSLIFFPIEFLLPLNWQIQPSQQPMLQHNTPSNSLIHY